jgi:hypothetical protein
LILLLWARAQALSSTTKFTAATIVTRSFLPVKQRPHFQRQSIVFIFRIARFGLGYALVAVIRARARTIVSSMILSAMKSLLRMGEIASGIS